MVMELEQQPVNYYYVPLSGRKGEGKFMVIDIEDKERVMVLKWYMNSGYATGYDKGRTFLAHRFILNFPDKAVDHINHDRLDNRRCNLRLCSTKENNYNSQSRTNTSSAYKGVSWHTKAKKWKAAICHNGKNKHIGLFTDETEAARAYNAKAQELFGSFAYLNDVPAQ